MSVCFIIPFCVHLSMLRITEKLPSTCVCVCLSVCVFCWVDLTFENDSLFKDYVDLQLGQAYPRFKDRDRVSPIFVLSFILLFENCACFVTACN